MQGMLQGIRVLDFGRFIAGPFCATLMADLGAEVIRVERLSGGEDRYLTPVTSDGQGALFLQVARGKKSVTLNPTKPEGREVVERLVRTADVVVANLPPETRRSLGLDYESLKAIKSDIILTTATAFGRGGPWSDRVGFDGLAQAMSGVMYMSGAEGQPTRSAASWVDFNTAAYCAFATLAALRHRDATGEGQVVEGALLKTALNAMGATLMEQDQLQLDRVATLNRGQTSGPSDTFRTADGHVMCLVIGQGQFERWCRLIDAEDLLEDTRFANDLDRGDNGEVLSERMAAWCATRTVEQVLDALETAKVPGGPVLSPQQAIDHAHVQEIGYLEQVEFPTADKPLLVPSTPFDLSLTPGKIRSRAPKLGEHTDEVLRSLGYGSGDIARLREQRVV